MCAFPKGKRINTNRANIWGQKNICIAFKSKDHQKKTKPKTTIDGVKENKTK